MLLLAPLAAGAQQLATSIWYFGNRAGLDFRSGAPRPLTDGFDSQMEGVSTISDPRTGQLLFHTDGDTVWNRNRRMMPNGFGLGGHVSATTSGIIVPVPDDSSRYYIFSTDAGEYYTGGTSMPYWSIVDMSLDGGLGDVAVKKQSLFNEQVTEKIAVVTHCSGRGYWVILHDLYNSDFLIWYLTRNGLEGPRRVPIGSPHDGTREGASLAAIGGIKFNSTGDRLAVANFGEWVIDLFDFDRRTGELSNARTIQAGAPVYDVCFSPDGTKLYATGERARFVAQYDVTRPSAAAIEASRVELYRSNWSSPAIEHMTGIQLGPDGRIYVSVKMEAQLSVITQPNLAGTACGYQHRSLALSNGAWDQPYGVFGLPSFVCGLYDPLLETCRPPRSRFRLSRAELCEGETLEITDESYDNPTSWSWTIPGGEPSATTERNPGTVRFATPGVYRVELVTSNANGADTFALEVTVNALPEIEAGPDRTICIGDAVQLEPATSGTATYRWSPAEGLSCTDCANPVARPTTTTRYRVVATSDRGCVSSDEVTVVVEPFPSVDAGRDTAICVGESVRLDGRGGTELRWSPAAGLSCTDCPNPIATPAVSTTYVLSTTNNGRCESVDSVRVTVSPRPVADAGPGATICRGDGARLRGSGGARYEWTPAASLDCPECAEPLATPTETTTYIMRAYSALGCASIDSVTVVVDPAPRLVHVGLGPDIGIAPGTELELPVVLEDSLDLARVSMIDLGVTYDPTIIQLRRAMLDSSLTEGWTAIVLSEDRSRGEFAARIIAPAGRTLSGIGTMARLRFQSFIHRGDSSVVRLSMRLADAECTRVETRPTVVRLDSVCGLNQRLMSSFGTGYYLRQNAPNPFSSTTTIEFSLGLDGPTRVEIVDAEGRTVAVLFDGVLAPGAHALSFDGSALPAGAYYCRVTSGVWSRTIAMVIGR